MIILSKEQILRLHTSLIEATGGSDGIRDERILDSALKILFNHLAEKNFTRAFRQKRHSFASAW